jgi:glucose/arabinose dehydrogenase/mono/diheme cytochrome c family protein
MSSQRGTRDSVILAIQSLAGLALFLPTALAAPAQFDDDKNPYRPGLMARYQGSDGAEHVRLEERLAHAWNADPPDRRVPPGPFTARYSGRLWTQSPGAYRLRVFAAGSVRLALNGELLLEAQAPRPRWLDARPIELPFGFHSLEVEYRRADEPAQIALYWSGPQFGLEPIGARWLFHDAGRTPSRDFERGERLVRALRCAACHQLPGEPDALRTPALDALSGNLSRSWFVDWLAGGTAEPKGDASQSSTRRMPHFDFSRDEAAAIADALLAASEPAPLATALSADAKTAQKERSGKKKRKKQQGNKDEDEPPPPSAAAGATLFRSIGCLACHRVGELGSDGPFGGGDLSRVADKRPADFFARWLTDPARANRDHRMPVFALDAHELASLSLYLQTLHGPAEGAVTNTVSRSAGGAALARDARCAACHALPKSLAAKTATERVKLESAALARGDNSCLFEPDPARFRPGYRLADDDRRAIQTFIAGIGRVSDPPVVHTGEQLLAEQNCLACHARGSSPGLTELLPAVAQADAALGNVLPALQPPALFGVGDKLQDEALATAIRTPESPRRPWLRVRMPKFPMSPQETDALVGYFVEHDRIPPPRDNAPQAETASHSDTALDAAGPRLVTADGFGCTSCHAIGDWTPQKVELNDQGSSLSQIGRRMRREWFDRWVRNPARIVPKMEMPAVQQAIRGVLDGQLDAQLAAVWRALDRPDFTPPAPDALRVVRRSNLPGASEPAAVLTDVIEVAGVPFVKPLVVGLGNRHNVLLDLATGRLSAWWIGDVARQRTRGKTWYWEAGQPQLLSLESHASDRLGDLSLVRGSEIIAPQPAGQYVTEFDLLEHVGVGLRVSYRLHFPLDGQTAVIRVAQEFAPLDSAPGERSGFRRRVQIENSPSEAEWELAALAGEVALDSQGRTATLPGPHGTVQVSLADDSPARLEKTPRGAVVVLSTTNGRPPACALEYRSEAVPDQFAPPPAIDRSVQRAELKVVPGFEAVRLPLTDRAMPTGLAWRGDGTLVVSSLEGRVWLGHDDDGDGLEDRLEPFSDELAAPYGVAAAGNSIDVINKYALLRLFDEDGDGHAERTELVASGWGHTRDYHDWVMGLPRDAEGNYYVSLPCEQDNRSAEGARFRGQALRLVPREPTSDDPRRFSLHKIAAGLRFPQGIALSRERELFVTDQQGHYNPFNELNHVVQGARYGFINSRERKKGFNPPFKTAAIEIPHPWTRSVNGICFLDTPEAVREKSGRDLFGPFEGHLVGCEYDTRRLVRMSLDRVGDDFQGAVYPLSREPAPGEQTFEGPLVCQVAPDGDLYIGNIRDSGWGAGTNTGSIVRMRFEGNLPPGIAEVRAVRGGFVIDFTAPVDRQRAARMDNYSISSYRRVSTPAYGGDDKDRRVEAIRTIVVSDDARSVTIRLDGLREGFVYEFHLRNLSGHEFFPDEAYYTLRHLPE